VLPFGSTGRGVRACGLVARVVEPPLNRLAALARPPAALLACHSACFSASFTIRFCTQNPGRVMVSKAAAIACLDRAHFLHRRVTPASQRSSSGITPGSSCFHA
jgi:hypothetical protein